MFKNLVKDVKSPIFPTQQWEKHSCVTGYLQTPLYSLTYQAEGEECHKIAVLF